MPHAPAPPQRQPLAAPGAWQWSARTGDVDAQAQAQPGWRQHYEQLSAGPFEGWVQHVQLPGLRLVREDSRCAVHQRGDLGQGAVRPGAAAGHVRARPSSTASASVPTT